MGSKVSLRVTGLALVVGLSACGGDGDVLITEAEQNADKALEILEAAGKSATDKGLIRIDPANQEAMEKMKAAVRNTRSKEQNEKSADKPVEVTAPAEQAKSAEIIEAASVNTGDVAEVATNTVAADQEASEQAAAAVEQAVEVTEEVTEVTEEEPSQAAEKASIGILGAVAAKLGLSSDDSEADVDENQESAEKLAEDSAVDVEKAVEESVAEEVLEEKVVEESVAEAVTEQAVQAAPVDKSEVESKVSTAVDTSTAAANSDSLDAQLQAAIAAANAAESAAKAAQEAAAAAAEAAAAVTAALNARAAQ